VDVGSAFVAGAQPLEGVQPGEAAFDDPAGAAKVGAVAMPRRAIRGVIPRSRSLVPVVVVVVAAVGVDLARLAPWSSSSAADRGYRVDQGDELGDVVVVAAGQGHGQGDAAGLTDQMVRETGPPTVDRRRTDVVPL
jgi:hypothetical protein